MRVAYLDCPSGISGDMFLGALVDAGWPAEALRDALGRLPIARDHIHVREVARHGIRATHVQFAPEAQTPARHLADLVALIRGAGLAERDEALAVSVVTSLGRIEAAIHGVPLADVHFHELSGLDTVLDVVGAVAGLRALGVERVYASPLNVGSGTVRTTHGVVPVPAPATARLLQGFEVYAAGEPGERVTPTGAALVAALASPTAGVPRMRLVGGGYGAGARDFAEPNVARLLLGETADGAGTHREELVILECNVDDMSPEYGGYAVERLLLAGALDAYLTPIVMKKGRLASMLSVLCRPSDRDALLRLVLTETSTLGVRERSVSRHALARETVCVETPFGAVRVKVAQRPDGGATAAPEYDDCRDAAARHGVPLRTVYDAALRARADASPGARDGAAERRSPF